MHRLPLPSHEFLGTIGGSTVPCQIGNEGFNSTGLSTEPGGSKMLQLNKHSGQEECRSGARHSYDDVESTLSAHFDSQPPEENTQGAPENLTSSPGLCQLVCGCLSRARAVLICCSCCHTGNQEPIQETVKISIQETSQSTVKQWCPGTY
ncbi:hypothetical protein MATL_G00025510 [Megalops atlanticus]|uniref:Uncharacterized protein n=1 Tax=Megalops atlanticus TaxID=7932 RepID=A0A9D3TFS3_MEGAT|nr:hypothetical protein MATL_G00025510 [Megalops atlanticus]